jgi:hypothetical protein
MEIRGGFHVEGNDYLVLRAIVSQILKVQEEQIIVDLVEASGRGWEFVLNMLRNALHRFYATCAQFAVIGVDNDGNVDLDVTSATEDARHPRHSNHVGTYVSECRYCTIQRAVSEARQELNWIPTKPGGNWPVIIAVPVEMIETWLLMRKGISSAQRRPRSVQKQMLYGKPAATREDVLNIALPLVRSMSDADLASLAQISPSFRDFFDQVIAAQAIILAATPCWE